MKKTLVSALTTAIVVGAASTTFGTKTDGTPMLMLTNAADTKIDASDVVLADSAEPLFLQKGDTVTLLTKDSTAEEG